MADSQELWAARIVAAVRTSGEALDDAQIAARLGARRRPTIASACRRLETTGLLRRIQGPNGTPVNLLTARHPSEVGPVDSRRIGVADLVSEQAVKSAVKTYLEEQGWSVRVAWRHADRARGVDIDAHRSAERLMLNAKAVHPTRRSR